MPVFLPTISQTNPSVGSWAEFNFAPGADTVDSELMIAFPRIRIEWAPRHSRRMDRSCLDRVTHQEWPGIGPQAIGISGVIIPAEGGLLGQVL
jgi:hypothetical protein